MFVSYSLVLELIVYKRIIYVNKKILIKSITYKMYLTFLIPFSDIFDFVLTIISYYAIHL